MSLNVDISSIATVHRNRETKETTLYLFRKIRYQISYGSSIESVSKAPIFLETDKKGNHILNLDENERYYFKVKTAKEEFYIAERDIPLKGARNFRDLGGFATGDLGYVKWGLLFRSEDLSSLTPNDLEYLDSIGINSIIDFRSESEMKKSPDRKPDSVKFNFPIAINPGAASSSNMSKPDTESQSTLLLQMQNMYRQYINDPTCIRAFKRMFLVIQNNHSSPLVLHCSAGKDRTGIAVALILFALGVSERDIMENYMESNGHIPTRYQEFMKRRPRSQPLFTVRRSYLRTSINEIKEKYGSIETFLVDILKADIPKLRRMYVSHVTIDKY